MTPLEISAEELHARLLQGEAIRLIDCREPWENEHCSIEGSSLIPMNDTPARLEELRALTGPLAVYCHHGVRSLQVVQWLRSQGVPQAVSLAGGIDAWSLQIDPAVRRY